GGAGGTGEAANTAGAGAGAGEHELAPQQVVYGPVQRLCPAHRDVPRLERGRFGLRRGPHARTLPGLEPLSLHLDLLYHVGALLYLLLLVIGVVAHQHPAPESLGEVMGWGGVWVAVHHAPSHLELLHE